MLGLWHVLVTLSDIDPTSATEAATPLANMADPRRYWIDFDGDKLVVTASPSGEWVKWHDFEDYKAAQRRNASAETNERLGIEIAEMRVLIEEMNNTINTSQAKCRELKEENERLRELLAAKGVQS